MEVGNEEERTRGGKKESGTTDISLDDSLITPPPITKENTCNSQSTYKGRFSCDIITVSTVVTF